MLQTELAHRIRDDDPKSLTGVIGALGNRVNQTPGLEGEKRGAFFLIEKDQADGLSYRMMEELHAAIDAIPKLREALSLTVDEIFEKYEGEQNWLRVEGG